LAKESDLIIRDGVRETHRHAAQCKYGEWSQQFECRSSGKEGIITKCYESEMEAHFDAICASAAMLEVEDTSASRETQQIAGKDVFLSHLSVDKETVVRPFSEILKGCGIDYWLDEAEINWGDDILVKVNEGLARARFVVCFISMGFADRNWPVAEFSSALGAQLHDGIKRVLPIIVGDPDTILKKLPILRSYQFRVWDGTRAVELAHELKRLLT
jgi:hypothetical protein